MSLLTLRVEPVSTLIFAEPNGIQWGPPQEWDGISDFRISLTTLAQMGHRRPCAGDRITVRGRTLELQPDDESFHTQYYIAKVKSCSAN